MKGNKEFTCMTCNQVAVHYCRGMCNPCYQRHLRQRNKSRVAKIQTAKAQTPVQRMKRDDYPYTPPKVGSQYQADLSQITRPSVEERQPDLVHKSDSIAPEEMLEYLHFCKVVFTDSLAEGDITKGSACLEEQALKLLRECNYNISRAKLAILFPIEYKLEPYSFDRITEEEVQRRVLQATVDLEEIKEEKREDYSKKLSDALKDKVVKEELEIMVQVARSIKVEIPPEVSAGMAAAEEFSSEVSALLEKKNLKPEEVQALAERSTGFAVITPTIAHVQQLARDCREWGNKVAAVLKGRPSTKQLQTLASEGSSLQVDLPELEAIRNKYKRTKKWAEALHALTKPAKFKKDFSKPNVSQISALLEEARELNFTHCEILGLENQVEIVSAWRERLIMWTNDVKEEEMNMEEMNDLLSEYDKLPFVLDTVKGLSCIKEMCQWMIKAANTLKKEEKVPAKVFKALVNEAKQISLQSGLLTTIEKEVEAANNWKSECKSIMKNCEPITLCELNSFYQRGLASKIDLEPLLKQVGARVARADHWQAECAALVASAGRDWGQVAKLEADMKELSLASEDAEALFAETKNALKWKQQADALLRTFPKEIPESSDFICLSTLISEAPKCMEQSEELNSLKTMIVNSRQWLQDCGHYLKMNAKGSADFSESLRRRARSHPVDVQLFESLVNHSNLLLWAASAEQALEGSISEREAKELLVKADSSHYIDNPVYGRLREAVELADKLSSRLKVVCKGGPTLESLMELYSEARRIPLQFESRRYLHFCLLSHYSFQQRAQSALKSSRSYSLYQSLIQEGMALLCPLGELKALEEAVAPCEMWRQKAAQVVNLGSIPHIDSEEELPCPYKRKLVVEEYTLQTKTDDLMDDLLTCVESAYEEEVVPSASVSATVDPLHGVTWVIHLPSSRQAQQQESKRKRIISQRIKELEGGLLEAAGKRGDKKSLACCHGAEAGETIACGKCKRNYHLACLGLESRPGAFFCESCSKHKDDDYPQSVPHTLLLPSLCSLLEEAKSLPLVLPEVSVLEKLQQRGEDWVRRVDEAIETYEKKSLTNMSESEVVGLLQEFEGMPFIFPQKDKLYIVLQALSWLQEAKSTVSDKTSMRTLKRLLKTASEIRVEQRQELAPLLASLQTKKQSIEFWSETLQRLQNEKAPLAEIKRFLEEPEVKRLQFDKFDNLKREAAQTEILAAKVAEALQNKRSDLAALERLQFDVQKAKVNHEVFQQLTTTISKMKDWVESVKIACQGATPSNDVLKQLLATYEEISCSHPLAQTLEDHIRVFCVCKQPDTGERPMINCDCCKDWFHYDCVGIPQGAAVEDLSEYMCPRCCQEEAVEYRFSVGK